MYHEYEKNKNASEPIVLENNYASILKYFFFQI